MRACRASLEDGLLTLENDRIRRRYEWNGGHLIGRELADLANGHTWSLVGEVPDCWFPGARAEPAGGDLAVTPRSATSFRPAHLQVDVTARLGALEVRRRFSRNAEVRIGIDAPREVSIARTELLTEQKEDEGVSG